MFFPELLRMVAKTVGLGTKIFKLRKKMGDIKYAVLSGKFLRVDNSHRNDVDVLIIGDVVLAELDVLVKEEEARTGREINYTVLGEEEFEFRKARRDPFLMEVLYGSRIMVIGNEEELVARKLPGMT
jgi:predicted nucleotidyltransferase